VKDAYKQAVSDENLERLRRKALENDLRSLDIPRQYKREISDRINDYVFFGGKLFWRVEEIPKLQGLLKAVLGLSTAAFVDCVSLGGCECVPADDPVQDSGAERG